MSFMASFLWSSVIWLALQLGLTWAAHYFLGGTDPMLRRGIFLASSVIVTVISMAFF